MGATGWNPRPGQEQGFSAGEQVSGPAGSTAPVSGPVGGFEDRSAAPEDSSFDSPEPVTAPPADVTDPPTGSEEPRGLGWLLTMSGLGATTTPPLEDSTTPPPAPVVEPEPEPVVVEDAPVSPATEKQNWFVPLTGELPTVQPATSASTEPETPVTDEPAAQPEFDDGPVHAEATAGEAVDAEAIDVDTVDAELIDPDVVDVDVVDVDVVDAEPVDAMTVGAEPVDAETFDAGTVDHEVGAAEAVDAEVIDVETIDAEPADQEETAAEAIDAEVVDAETIDAEPADEDEIAAGGVEAEVIDAEVIDVETVDAEDAEEGDLLTEGVSAEGLAAEPVDVRPVDTETVEDSSFAAWPAESSSAGEGMAEAETIDAEWTEAEPVHAEPVHAEPVHAEPVHAEPVHAEPVHAEPSVTWLAEDAGAGTESVEPEPFEAEVVEPELVEPELVEPELVADETVEDTAADAETVDDITTEGDTVDDTLIDAEPVENTVVDAEIVEAELVDEPFEAQAVEAEMVEPEPTETETVEADPADAEPLQAEQVDAWPVDDSTTTEPEVIETAPAETHAVHAEAPEPEPDQAEVAEPETAQAETAEPEPVEAVEAVEVAEAGEAAEAEEAGTEPTGPEPTDPEPPTAAAAAEAVEPAPAEEPGTDATPEPVPEKAAPFVPLIHPPIRQQRDQTDRAAARRADPEQVLSAYPLVFDPATLREEIEDGDPMWVVVDRLTDKLEYAERDAVRARLLSLRAVAQRLLGELDAALEDGRAALAHAEATGELRRVAVTRARLAHVLQWRGEFAEADRLYAQAGSPELPDRLRAEIHELAGRSAFEQGRYLEAVNHFDIALDLRKGADPQLVERLELALDTIAARTTETWGPYPRTREEILGEAEVPRPLRDERSGLFGYVGALPPQFAQAQPFAEGVAWVRRPESNAWELIDESGASVFDASSGYLAAEPFAEGLAWVTREPEGGWYAVDRQNRVIVPGGFEDAQPFRHGLALIRRGGWGAIDRHGRIVVQPHYRGFATVLASGDQVDGFTDEGLAVVDAGDVYGVVDRTGHLIVPPVHAAVLIHPTAFLIADKYALWGALDRSGEPLVELKFSDRADVLEVIERSVADARPVL